MFREWRAARGSGLADFTILKVDPGKSPPTIDLRRDKRVVIWSAREDPDANQAMNLQGIYHLEGDTLKLFVGEEARPRAFPAGEKQGVVTLKRVVGRKGERKVPPK